MTSERQSTDMNPEMQVAVDSARGWIEEQAPHLSRIFNIDGLDMRVGNGWATEYQPGGGVRMTVDPAFFVERGHKPEWAVYGTVHEITAHIKEALWNPKLTESVLEFIKQGEAQSIFHNIFSDIAGNKAMHARLPRLEDVAEDIYRNKLMPDDPPAGHESNDEIVRYRDMPRHLQFLYKVIRQEMISDSFTIVSPEVDQAIDRLRDFQGSGQDVIRYSTDVVKPDGQPSTPEERFGLWVRAIYPEYEALLEQDKQDPRFTESEDGQQSGDNSENQSQQDAGDGDQSEQSQDGNENDPSDTDGDNSGDKDGRFRQYYDEYHSDRHPEPLDDDTHEVLHDVAKHIIDQQKSQPRPDQKIDQKIRQETGHSLQEQISYNRELMEYSHEIEKIRDLFFKQIISPQLEIHRRLGKTPRAEGAILNPDRLAETIIDIRSGNEDPAAFVDYEHGVVSAETIGNTDYYLVVDRSQSMSWEGGDKARAAATSTLIFLEGLAGIQKDIEEAEAEYGLELEMSIRSCVYTFGNGADIIKPLSKELSTKERLDSYQAAGSPLNEGTADYLALESILDNISEGDRRKVIVVITDGESSQPTLATEAISKIRARKDSTIMAISIGSEEAVELYRPDARRCDNPRDLPNTLANILRSSLL